MYICERCGNVFDAPEIFTERHPYGMGYAEEKIAISPCCKDTNFTEAKECERCGELVAELNDDLCDVCYGDVYGEE